MQEHTATAIAHPNIAFIKYWGNLDHTLRLPLNGSISMNLDGFTTTTTVRFDPRLDSDQLEIDGKPANPAARLRVSDHLSLIRQMANIETAAAVISTNNFPMGSGIASSASAFAALSLAASQAAGLSLDPIELSRLARRGSGSACRSVPAGVAEWHFGLRDEESFAEQLVPINHWDLVDCLVITDTAHKHTGSTDGHLISKTSPYQDLRVSDACRRLDICRRAILGRDFEAFAEVVEQDSNMMHSVMSTSQPRLNYLNDVTIDVVAAVIQFRKGGHEACYTIDAGPNVHVITRSDMIERIKRQLSGVSGILRIVVLGMGTGAQLIDSIHVG